MFKIGGSNKRVVRPASGQKLARLDNDLVESLFGDGDPALGDAFIGAATARLLGHPGDLKAGLVAAPKGAVKGEG